MLFVKSTKRNTIYLAKQGVSLLVPMREEKKQADRPRVICGHKRNRAKFKVLHIGPIPSWHLILDQEEIYRPNMNTNMNTIEHHFHRESVVHILLEEDACSASRSTGTSANHLKTTRKGRILMASGRTAASVTSRMFRPLQFRRTLRAVTGEAPSPLETEQFYEGDDPTQLDDAETMSDELALLIEEDVTSSEEDELDASEASDDKGRERREETSPSRVSAQCDVFQGHFALVKLTRDSTSKRRANQWHSVVPFWHAIPTVRIRFMQALVVFCVCVHNCHFSFGCRWLVWVWLQLPSESGCSPGPVAKPDPEWCHKT